MRFNYTLKNTEKYKAICFFVNFSKDDLLIPAKKTKSINSQLNCMAERVTELYENLDKDGFVLLYGVPNYISLLADKVTEKCSGLSFRYWIAINSNDHYSDDKNVVRNHIACVLLYNNASDILDLDTESCRIARFACACCGKNSKDWGGKKHLVNKKGTAVSDVWNDYIKVDSVTEDPQIPGLLMNVSRENIPSLDFYAGKIPEDVLIRLLNLTKSINSHVIINLGKIDYSSLICQKKTEVTESKIEFDDRDKVECADSIAKLKDLHKKYPEGVFDLIFADPPYNLNKSYNNYEDGNADRDYINWCNKWLKLCLDNLKPNGNMLVLNIPKWALTHISFLADYCYIENCIVWDAMSTPLGKVMPAHYSLIHFRKNYSDKTICNTSKYTPTLNYCSRSNCIKNRAFDGLFSINDIWSDLHRIKHKKDRDEHPCQLPDSLMKRIIETFSDEGDLVYDPFCGAGTTAINAKMLNRHFYSTDISQEYVDITNRKLQNLDEFGFVVKESEKKIKRKHSKKEMEIYTEEVFTSFGRDLTEEEFLDYIRNDTKCRFSIDDVISVYGSTKELLKKCKIVLK